MSQSKYKGPWVAVEKRDDLGNGGSTRVMMFVRGVGMRLGVMTVLFEKPWRVIDPDWHGEERDLELNNVACYISLEHFPWPINWRPGDNHVHEFVPPANDDEQQCDTDCRMNWHKCKTCGKSRTELGL